MQGFADSAKSFFSPLKAGLVRPPEGLSKGRTVASLLCGILFAGLGLSLVGYSQGEYGVSPSPAVSAVGVALILSGLAEASGALSRKFTIAVRALAAALLITVPIPVIVWAAISDGALSFPVVIIIPYALIALSELKALLGYRSESRESGFYVEDESRPAAMRSSDGTRSARGRGRR